MENYECNDGRNDIGEGLEQERLSDILRIGMREGFGLGEEGSLL